MAFATPFVNIDSLNFGLVLQIAFSQGIRQQLSTDFQDWTVVSRLRIANTLARQLQFMSNSTLGMAAIQYVNPGVSGRAFPGAQQSSVSEHIAKLKEIDATIEIEHNMWERAMKSPEKYGEPLALEMENKAVGSKRLIASGFYGDGSGRVCEVSSVDDLTSLASDFCRVTVANTTTSAGFFGNIHQGDLLMNTDNDGTAPTIPTETSGNSFYCWRVKSKARKAKTVDLEPVDSSGNVVTDITASNIAAGDYFFRIGQVPGASGSSVAACTSADWTGSIADYGTISNCFPGLESLAASDGRVVHQMTMSGAFAGSRLDASTSALSCDLVHEMMDNVKINVGESTYKYKLLSMSPEAQRAFIDLNETDRRLGQGEGERGGAFTYRHRNDVLSIYCSEFVPDYRVYALPEASGSKKVLEFWGTDFATVKGMGTGDFHLKPASGGGHTNMMVSYMRAYNTLLCKHPAAIASLHNFTL